MIKLVLAAHGQFASGIVTSIKLIAGEQENLEIVDFVEGMTSDDVKEKIKQAAGQAQDVLILTDLLGGTPFKVSVELATEASEQNIEVISGMNLAMALEACLARAAVDLQTLSSSLVVSARDGIISATQLLVPIEEELIFEDGI